MQFNITASAGFHEWLESENVSLAISTYQAGKLILIGRQDLAQPRLGVFERTFNRCTGLWSDGQTMWISSRSQLWRLENVSTQIDEDGFDRLFVPRIGYTTGDIDIHDIAVDDQKRPIFVNTLFNCLATTSDRFNFAPIWKPEFISKLVAEDRCHLNGLAMRNGQPGYVSACGQSDVVDGWRDGRRDGGCVIDVESNQIVANELTMPHSPRWYRDQLWILNSGEGYFGFIDLASGKFERVAFCPGYSRGMTFIGDYVVIGLSRPRKDEESFQNLALDDELKKRNAVSRCGVQIIDLGTGNIVEWLLIDGGLVSELYDVIVLPDVVRPKAYGFKTDEIHHNVWFESEGKVLSWSADDNS
jgi:uncharacterized protein (TIGR03032 family)